MGNCYLRIEKLSYVLLRHINYETKPFLHRQACSLKLIKPIASVSTGGKDSESAAPVCIW